MSERTVDLVQSETDQTDLADDAFEEPERGPSGMSIRRVAVSLVVVIAIVAAIYLLDSGQRDAVAGATSINVAAGTGAAPRVGSQAPEFELKGLDGKPVKLSDFRGQPVWINFWASWCPPCRAETPDVEAAYNERKDQGLVLLAISIGEDAPTVKRYVDTSGITSTVLLDVESSIAGLYRVNGIPTHFFVDKDGVVRDLVVGGLSRANILRRLDAIAR